MPLFSTLQNKLSKYLLSYQNKKKFNTIINHLSLIRKIHNVEFLWM
jgi:hypothetical protein